MLASLPLTLAFLCVAGFFSGLLNSVAGGGGLLRLPAMLLAGMTPQQAIAANKFCGMIGHGTALAAFARKGYVPWKPALAGLPCAMCGSALGSRYLLDIPPELAGKIVAILLPAVALALLVPRKKAPSCVDTLSRRQTFLVIPAISLCVGCYDGMFGPGAGTFFILGFHFFARMELVRANALSKVFSAAGNVGATAVFLLHGQVLFIYAVPAAITESLGNLVGSRLAILKGSPVVKKFLVLSLMLLFASLLFKYVF